MICFDWDLTPVQEQKEAYKLRKDIEHLKRYPFLVEMFPTYNKSNVTALNFSRKRWHEYGHA
ncbi:MAG: hypothetical protein R3B92_02750 [Patescibacteria group bacterium]